MQYEVLEKLNNHLLPEPNEVVNAAVLVPIILPKNPEEEPFLYLQVRSETVRQPGEISFPGGHTETGETPIQTALRETEEEFGLPQDAFEILGCLPLHRRRRSVYTVQAVVAVAREADLPEVRANEEEVAEIFRLPLRFLLETPVRWYTYEPENHNSDDYPPALYRYLTRYNDRIETHYWEYEKKGIWGLTARLLNMLVETIRQENV